METRSGPHEADRPGYRIDQVLPVIVVIIMIMVMMVVPVIMMVMLPAFPFPALLPISPVMFPVMGVIGVRMPYKHGLRSNNNRLRGHDNGRLADKKRSRWRSSPAYI